MTYIHTNNDNKRIKPNVIIIAPTLFTNSLFTTLQNKSRFPQINTNTLLTALSYDYSWILHSSYFYSYITNILTPGSIHPPFLSRILSIVYQSYKYVYFFVSFVLFNPFYR